MAPWTDPPDDPTIRPLSTGSAHGCSGSATSGHDADRVAAATGISKSTLSRLETGQRRPSLELLLPLAQAYRVPLDDLVGAPEVGDPRIRLKPGGSTAGRCFR